MDSIEYSRTEDFDDERATVDIYNHKMLSHPVIRLASERPFGSLLFDSVTDFGKFINWLQQVHGELHILESRKTHGEANSATEAGHPDS